MLVTIVIEGYVKYQCFLTGKNLGYNSQVTEIKNESQMLLLGERLGQLVEGGHIIELVGDVGAGKTTLVRGLARGMGVDEPVQSPSFTISRLYDAPDGRHLAHYDFYRLKDPGIMASELADTIGTDNTIVVIEWADSVENTLPDDRLIVSIESPSLESRHVIMKSGGEKSDELKEAFV